MPNRSGHDLAIKQRMRKQLVDAGLPDDPGVLELVEDPNKPRWRVDSKVVEFECGCRAIRCRRIFGMMEEWDPIIFTGLSEQAIYDSVCARHEAGMNVRCGFGGFVDFSQWKRARQSVLLGKTVGHR